MRAPEPVPPGGDPDVVDPLTAAFVDVVRRVVREELAAVIEELRAVAGAGSSPAAYKVAEIAERYGIAERTVYDAIARGDLKALHAGRSVRVPAEAVQAWLSRRPS